MNDYTFKKWLQNFNWKINILNNSTSLMDMNSRTEKCHSSKTLFKDNPKLHQLSC